MSSYNPIVIHEHTKQFMEILCLKQNTLNQNELNVLNFYVDLLKDEYDANSKVARQNGALPLATDGSLVKIRVDPAALGVIKPINPKLRRQNYAGQDELNETLAAAEFRAVTQYVMDLVATTYTRAAAAAVAHRTLILNKFITGDNFFKNLIFAHFDTIGVGVGAAAGDARIDLDLVTSAIFSVPGGPGSVIPVGAPVAPVLTFRLTKHLLRLLLKSASADVDTPSAFFDEEGETDGCNTIRRDGAMLYKMDKDGKRVDLSNGSQEYANNEKERCVGTMVNETVGLTCNDYISKCIYDSNRNNIDQCKAFMASPDFWEVTKEEVRKMNPEIILSTLESFKFTKVTKNGLTSFETVGEWLARLRKLIDLALPTPSGKLSQADFDRINNNDKLTTYLNMLVKKINCNPPILNPLMKGPKGPYPDDASRNARYKGWKFAKYGLTPLVLKPNSCSGQLCNGNGRRQLDLLGSSLVQVYNAANSRVRLGTNGIIFVGNAPLTNLSHFNNYVVQAGGSANSIVLRKNGPIVEQLYKGIVANLAEMNKNITAGDDAKIKSLIDNYKKTEEKLMDSIKYTNKYIDIVKNYGQYDNDNVLSLSHIVDFVQSRDKYYNKLSNQQMTVSDVLGKILSLLESK